MQIILRNCLKKFEEDHDTYNEKLNQYNYARNINIFCKN